MQFKKYTKQRLGGIQGLRSFKDTLPTKVKKIINKKGSIFPEILNNWKYIVGKELFDICYPNKFKSSNRVRGSTLEIMVNRGSEVDVEYSKKQILNKLNSIFGYAAVDKIKIITFEKNEIDEIWLTFPDPQIKFQRRKHRLTNTKFLSIYKNILNDSGIIHLKTDSEFLHGYTLGKLEEMSINPIVSNHDIYKNSNAPVEATQIQTHYEKIYLNEGKKITYLNFKFNE